MKNNYTIRNEFFIGERATITKSIAEDDIIAFAEASGDYNPLHLDPEFASRTRFKGCIAHGMLCASLISALLGTKLPGPGSIYFSQNLRFLQPVRAGDIITAEVEVTQWDRAKHTIRLKTQCRNDSGEQVLDGDAFLLIEPLLELAE